MFGGAGEGLVIGFDRSVGLLGPGVGRRGALLRIGLASRKSPSNVIKINNQIHLLLLTVPGSIFGLNVTSCEEDFLGIRNAGVMVFGAGKAFAVVPVDGLVSLAASRGGDVTDVLFAFVPDGTDRVRFFDVSLIVVGIAF